jgi:hypothetical protein
MADAITLIFADDPSDEEFLEVVERLGGERHVSETIDGLLRRDPATVWVSLKEKYLPVLDDEEIARYEAKLGAPVARQVMLEMLRAEGSDRVALDIVEEAAKRWRFVIDNGWGEVFTLDELHARIATDPPHLFLP